MTWSAVANASGYTATLLDSTGTTELGTVSCGPSATTASFSGLNPSTTYTVHVVAKGDGVTYSDSDPAEDTFNTVASGPALSAPTNLGFSNTTPVSTTLSWTGDSNATGYQLVIIEGTEIGDLHNVTLTATFASATYSPNSSATSYSNRTINDGNLGTWTATQCRIDNAGGPTIRAEGTLTSPEISGSVSAVEFDYTWPYGDSGNVDIDLYAGSTKVGTSTITASQGTSGTATYSNLSIDGPTTLEFRNTAGSNKRMTVTTVRIFCPVNVVIEDTIGPVTTYTAEGLSPSTTYSFVVSAVATNAQGTVVSTSAAATANITTRSNAAPTLSINPANSTTLVGGHTLSVALSANDTDTGDPVTLSVSPDNLGTFSDNGNTFTWTPAANASGTQNFTFTATDPYGASATADLAVTVSPNQNPELVSDATGDAISILEGQTATAEILADDDDGDTVTPSLSSFDGTGTPSFNPSTGAFSWTAPDGSAGTYHAVFSASDGFGGSASLTLTITVTSANANAAPVVTVSPASVAVNVRDSVEAEITAYDPNGDNVILTMTSEDIPQSAFDEDDGYGVLIWTAPTTAGTYTASFTATDDADDPLTSEAVTFTVVVTNAAPEIILSDDALSCNAGEEISTTVMGSDLFAAPTLSKDTGTLGTPSVATNGNNCTAEATWSWTPTTPGTHTITFTATDADDSSLFVTTTLTVTVGLAAPMNLAARNIASTSATLSWNIVTGATSYCVSATYVDGTFTNAVFTETFNQNTGSGGHSAENLTGWAGNGNPSAALKTDVSGWSCTKQNGAYQCAKFGTGSAKGEATTPPIGANGGTAHLLFRAAPWQGDSNKDLVLTVVGDGSLGQTEFTLVSEEWKDFETTLTGATSSTKITFAAETSDHNRFFLDEVSVVYFEPNVRTIPEVSVSGTSYTATGLSPETTYTYSVKATYGTVESSPATVEVSTTAPSPPATMLIVF